MRAADVVPLFEAQAAERMRAGGAVPSEGRSVEQAAREFGVSARAVYAARALRDAAPDLASRVFAGEITMSTAQAMLKYPGSTPVVYVLQDPGTGWLYVGAAQILERRMVAHRRSNPAIACVFTASGYEGEEATAHAALATYRVTDAQGDWFDTDPSTVIQAVKEACA